MKYKKYILLPMLLALPLMAEGTDSDKHEVIQKDKTFSVKEITVKLGESISFKNDDGVVHNVFSNTPGMEFDLRTQQPGKSSDVKFDKAGDCEVRCAIHSRMKLLVHVKN